MGIVSGIALALIAPSFGGSLPEQATCGPGWVGNSCLNTTRISGDGHTYMSEINVFGHDEDVMVVIANCEPEVHAKTYELDTSPLMLNARFGYLDPESWVTLRLRYLDADGQVLGQSHRSFPSSEGHIRVSAEIAAVPLGTVHIDSNLEVDSGSVWIREWRLEPLEGIMEHLLDPVSPNVQAFGGDWPLASMWDLSTSDASEGQDDSNEESPPTPAPDDGDTPEDAPPPTDPTTPPDGPTMPPDDTPKIGPCDVLCPDGSILIGHFEIGLCVIAGTCEGDGGFGEKRKPKDPVEPLPPLSACGG